MLAHVYDVIAPRFEMANWPGRSWQVSAVADSTVALLSVVNIFTAQPDCWSLPFCCGSSHLVDLFVRVLGYFEPPVADA